MARVEGFVLAFAGWAFFSRPYGLPLKGFGGRSRFHCSGGNWQSCLPYSLIISTVSWLPLFARSRRSQSWSFSVSTVRAGSWLICCAMGTDHTHQAKTHWFALEVLGGGGTMTATSAVKGSRHNLLHIDTRYILSHDQELSLPRHRSIVQ